MINGAVGIENGVEVMVLVAVLIGVLGAVRVGVRVEVDAGARVDAGVVGSDLGIASDMPGVMSSRSSRQLNDNIWSTVRPYSDATRLRSSPGFR